MKKFNLMVAIATFCLGSFSAHAQDDGQQMLTQGVDSTSGSGQQFALRILAPISHDTKNSDDPADANANANANEPDADTIIGGRMMLDDNMGIDVDVSLNLRSDDPDGLELGISGALINYLSKGRVAPYYKAGAEFMLFSGDLSDNKDNMVGVFGGLGAEFFVVPEFSIFAEAGLSVPLAPDFAITTYNTKAGIAFYF